MTPEQIRAWREARGLSTAEAAARIGKSVRSWQMYEAGDVRVPETVVRLLEAIDRLEGVA